MMSGNREHDVGEGRLQRHRDEVSDLNDYHNHDGRMKDRITVLECILEIDMEYGNENQIMNKQ